MTDEGDVPRDDELSREIRTALASVAGTVDRDLGHKRVQRGVRRLRRLRAAAAIMAIGSVSGAVAGTALVFDTRDPGDNVVLEPGEGPARTTTSVVDIPQAPGRTTTLEGWHATDVEPTVFGEVTITRAVTFDNRAVAVGCIAQGSVATGFPAWTGTTDDDWIQAVAAEPVDCLDDVVATPFGLFASGVRGVWRSSDGRAWDRVRFTDDPAQLEYGLYGPLFVLGDRVTVLRRVAAQAESTVANLFSTTDGETWSEYDDEAALFDSSSVAAVIGGGRGLLAVGASPGGEFVPTAAVWTSNDGLNWERVTPPSEGFTNAFMAAITTTDDGYLAVGGDSFQTGLMAAWTSTDGIDWRRSPPTGETVDPDTAFMFASAVTRVGDEVFAAGSDFDARRAPESIPALWSSHDGIAWERVNVDTDMRQVPFAIIALADSEIGFWPPPQWPTREPALVLASR